MAAQEVHLVEQMSDPRRSPRSFTVAEKEIPSCALSPELTQYTEKMSRRLTIASALSKAAPNGLDTWRIN